MSALEPDKLWWTADELAEAGLPDLPGTKRSVNRLADRRGWKSVPGCARRKPGKGGGWEYHWSVLPQAAQRQLLQGRDQPQDDRPGRDEAWAAFEALPETSRQTARDRLAAIQVAETLHAAGQTHVAAVAEAARLAGVSTRTLYNWLGLIDGVAEADRLPYLAPRHRTVQRRAPRAEYSEEFWEVLKSDYLRLEQPSFSSCYRRAVRIAKAEGWTTATEQTMRRRLKAEISKPMQVLCRKGVEALRRMYPAQTRDRLSLSAMEAVNADYHRFDVFVRWPGQGNEAPEIVRPQLIAFQDIYSGRILSWRIDKTPNKVGVSLALGDMIERFGIPQRIVLDNGREFANKFLTGGVKTRYRFKVKDDDIPGILVTLGVQVHWATPYSGQSKPIERAFRDLADDIAKDPRFAGAYTGNSPDAKPENYASRAIPLDQFIQVVAEGIEEHNARDGRRGQTTAGRSILETFEASYSRAPIRKATAEQRRLWLMGAEGVRVHSRTALIRFMGNEYHAAWMHEIAGRRVVARFDPADLRAGLHLYALSGEYLGLAECRVAGGFFDLDEARSHASARKAWVKAEKAAAEAARRFDAAELGAYLDGAATATPPEAATPEAKVVRPAVFDKAPRPQPVARELTAEERAERESFVADFQDHAQRVAARETGKDDARARFARALEMEARLADGEALDRDQERWLEGYRSTPEYAAHKAIQEDFSSGKSG